MNRRTLHMLVGLPGSGKSTFARVGLRDAVQVSHDKLVASFGNTAPVDAQIFATAAEKAVVKSALLSGKDVVLDRLNLSADHRATWIKLANECGASVVGYFWDIGSEQQWLGNLNRAEHKKVTLSKFQKMMGLLERPRLAEGFTELFNVIQDEYGFRDLRPAVE